METSEKRRVPTLLKKVLATDAYLTDILVKSLEKFLSLRQLKVHYKLLEISCNSILWISTIFIFIWFFNNKNLYQMQVNLTIGLLIDIVLVSMLKAIARRRSPATNDEASLASSNKYSFPSGHASRAAFVVYFFFHLWPVSLIYVPSLLAWSFSVCMSRLLIRTHHILDVLGGILLGIFEALLVGYIYLEQEICISIISWITDEKMYGPEYDV